MSYLDVLFPSAALPGKPTCVAKRKLSRNLVAAEAGCPIVPGVLRGTRSILRANQWFPSRGMVEVEIGEPIWPTGKDFRAVLQLRDAVRQAMLSCCGELDLGGLMKPAA
jgi:hypothetical protein